MFSLHPDSYEDKILSLLESKNKGMHRTLTGRLVKIGTKECQKDILKRIEDICHHRDTSDYGSDARVYFSGVLRVLRRRLRENDKIMETDKVKKSKKKITETIDKLNDESAMRILHLSGIL